MQKILVAILFGLSLLVFTFSCTDYKYIDDNEFKGTWELHGRDLYNGMIIQIEKKNDKLIGKIVEIPKNKYGTMFLEEGDIWISDINRIANYYFKITEKKIASELFSVYDLPTSTEHYAYFSEDNNIIYLSQKAPNLPMKSTTVFFKRIK